MLAVVVERRIEQVALALRSVVVALDLALNWFVLCKSVAVVLKNLLLVALIAYALLVDWVPVVA